jgi:hypothetical protein
MSISAVQVAVLWPHAARQFALRCQLTIIPFSKLCVNSFLLFDIGGEFCGETLRKVLILDVKLEYTKFKLI